MSVMLKQKMGKEAWLLLGAMALGAACIWPLQQLRTLPEKHAAVDRQLMQVQAIAAQAQQLRTQQIQPLGNAAELLQVAVSSTLGASGTVSMAGNTASVVVQRADAQQLAAALQAIRQQTAARFTSAKLNVQAEQVSGRLELQLPAGQP